MLNESKLKIAIIAGSNRKGSTSTKLCTYLQKQLDARGCTVTLYDLYVHPIPFFSPDERDKRDDHLHKLFKTTEEADGIILSTPDYHGGISGVLKNALDYLGGDQFREKPVLSVSSAGGAVGVSSLLHLQAIVRNVHGINCPEWISIGGEQRQFDEQGTPLDARTVSRVEQALDCFLRMTEKLQKPL